MRIEAALERFLVQLRADGRSGHTIRQYQRHVRLLARWARHVARCRDRVESLDHEAVAEFLASRAATTRPDGRAKKSGSTNCLRSSIKVFLRYLHDAGYTPSDPGRLIRRAICAPPPPRALSEDERRRLLDVLAAAHGPEGRRDHALFRTMLATGIRVGSAVAIEVEDVDLDKSEIRLRTTKGDRPEVVLLARGIRRHLRRYLERRAPGPLFPGRRGGRLSTRHVARRLGMWARRAGIERAVSPHALRHTRAAEVYRTTGDIAFVQAALGHRSIASTLRYAGPSVERLRRILT